MKKAILFFAILLGTKTYAQQIIQPQVGDIVIIEKNIFWKYDSTHAAEKIPTVDLTGWYLTAVGHMYLNGDSTFTQTEDHYHYRTVVTYNLNGSVSFYFQNIPSKNILNPYPTSKTFYLSKKEMLELTK
jgi:hypothetical protein